MTTQQFIEAWNGKYCEVAGSADAKNQCVDLANQYIKDVLGLPIIEWTNAKDFPSKAGDLYEYIKNTPSGVPKEGDLVIWGGTYGHIAIFVEGNADSFRSFDQNYPTGSPCHIQNHNYNNVLGWLHPKHTVNTDEVCMPKSQAEDFNRVKAGWNQVRELLNVEDSTTVVVAEIKKLIGYEDKVISTEKDLKKAQDKILELEGKLESIEPKHDQTAQDVQAQGQDIQEIKDGVAEVKQAIQVPSYIGWRKTLYELVMWIIKEVK